MKLIFRWIDPQSSQQLEPYCYVVKKCGSEVEDSFNALTSLLTDNGGRGYLSVISWPDEGLKLIAAIRRNELNVCNWCTDSWGAELTNNEVKIYSLYDEDYCDQISLTSFEVVLMEWKKFIQSEPKVEYSFELDL